MRCSDEETVRLKMAAAGCQTRACGGGSGYAYLSYILFERIFERSFERSFERRISSNDRPGGMIMLPPAPDGSEWTSVPLTRRELLGFLYALDHPEKSPHECLVRGAEPKKMAQGPERSSL